jgi:hypothetical protein
MRAELLGELRHPQRRVFLLAGHPMPEIPDTNFLFAMQ